MLSNVTITNNSAGIGGGIRYTESIPTQFRNHKFHKQIKKESPEIRQLSIVEDFQIIDN